MLEDQLATLKCEHDDLSRSMYEAAQVQRRLCGPRHLRAGSYEFASEIFPMRHLSGDFITVMQLEGELVFAIGDIAGKGPVAAMWFTHVVGMIRQQILALGDPAAALSAANRDLLLTGLELPLTTLFLARVNLESGDLTYCNAGHPPALLKEAKAFSGSNPGVMLFSVLAAVENFAGSQHREDDIALIMLRRFSG